MGTIKGYSFSQALLVYALVNISYTFAEIIGKGINHISDLIRQGTLDSYFLRPQPILCQVMGSGIEISRVGRLVQSIFLLAVALYSSDVRWTILKIFTIVTIPIGGIILFLCLYIFFAALTFFSVNNINVSLLLMGSGSDALHYPAVVMGRGVRIGLTYIFPFSLINYYPFLFVFDKVSNPMLAIVPLVSIGLFFIVLVFWRFGLKNYSSTGS